MYFATAAPSVASRATSIAASTRERKRETITGQGQRTVARMSCRYIFYSVYPLLLRTIDSGSRSLPIKPRIISGRPCDPTYWLLPTKCCVGDRMLLMSCCGPDRTLSLTTCFHLQISRCTTKHRSQYRRCIPTALLHLFIPNHYTGVLRTSYQTSRAVFCKSRHAF